MQRRISDGSFRRSIHASAVDIIAPRLAKGLRQDVIPKVVSFFHLVIYSRVLLETQVKECSIHYILTVSICHGETALILHPRFPFDRDFCPDESTEHHPLRGVYVTFGGQDIPYWNHIANYAAPAIRRWTRSVSRSFCFTNSMTSFDIQSKAN